MPIIILMLFFVDRHVCSCVGCVLTMTGCVARALIALNHIYYLFCAFLMSSRPEKNWTIFLNVCNSCAYDDAKKAIYRLYQNVQYYIWSMIGI